MAKRNRNLRLAEEILNRILDKQGPQGGLWILRSGNQLVDHFAVDIRQPEVPARVTVG